MTGHDASVTFHLKDKPAWMHSEVLAAEEGAYVDGTWKTARLLNGDETDRGFGFHKEPTVVRVTMNRF